MKFYEYFKEGFLVGYVISAGFVTASLMSYHFFIWLHYFNHKCTTRTKVSPLTKTQSSPRLKAYDGQICKLSSHEVSVLERWIARMSFDEINKATGNFSNENIIGVGKMGTMYKAKLQNGTLIAVKRLNPKARRVQLEKHFVSEAKSAGRLRHNNLVPLLGFCVEGKENILVYKYMPNGNLRDWLCPTKEEDHDKAMEWPLRLKIAIGVARALAWLHHGCSSFSLAHLNITSGSILLDLDFEPKISNFSQAIIMFTNPEVDYLKNDVYSFGIVLLELLTMKERAGVMSSFESGGTEEQLIEYVARILSSDKYQMSRACDYEIFAVLRVASKCVRPDPDQRPSMVQVYKRLRAVGERFGLTYDSGMMRPPRDEVLAAYTSPLVVVEDPKIL